MVPNLSGILLHGSMYGSPTSDPFQLPFAPIRITVSNCFSKFIKKELTVLAKTPKQAFKRQITRIQDRGRDPSWHRPSFPACQLLPCFIRRWLRDELGFMDEQQVNCSLAHHGGPHT